MVSKGPEGPPQGPEGPLGPRAMRAHSTKNTTLTTVRRQLKGEIYLHGIALCMSWVDGTSAQREPNSLKMTMLAPRWAVLNDFGVILRHVGGKMVTKSARMSQHRRQGPNPRGFEGFAASPHGRAPAGSPGHGVFWLGGRRGSLIWR